jgi:hypothetical protein
MRFGTRSGVFAVAALALVCNGAPAGATDIPIPGKIAIVKAGKLAKLVAKPVSAFTIPGIGSAGDPVINGGEVNFFDTAGSGILTDTLGAGTWTGLGSPAGAKGWKYSNTGAPAGGAVKLIIMKTAVIKILAKSNGTVDGPLGGELGITLETGTDNRCAELGGTSVKDEAGLIKKKDAPAPGTCPSPSPPCCNSAAVYSFTTADAPGDCGDIIDAGGMVAANLACSGLYFGGGGNSVPLPSILPDQGQTIAAITACASDVATLGPASSVVTGSNRTCTAIGCLFGAPLAVPNSASTPTSTCVINRFTGTSSGSLDCATGAVSQDLPLGSIIYLTGDTATDPGATIAGIQPCPLCSAGTCIGGPNNGMGCAAGTSGLSASYPTSHDCPPDPMFDIGTLPIAFAPTSGAITWTGTTATNDTGSTVSVQSRVFAGYCRDADGTSAFDGPPAVQCWQNGMAVGSDCSGTFESCEQRNNGAFGPNGGANRTLTEIGSPVAGILGGSASGTIVSLFAIPPTFNATVDAAADLPGPGAVALPGTGDLCANAMSCP